MRSGDHPSTNPDERSTLELLDTHGSKFTIAGCKYHFSPETCVAVEQRSNFGYMSQIRLHRDSGSLLAHT